MLVKTRKPRKLSIVAKKIIAKKKKVIKAKYKKQIKNAKKLFNKRMKMLKEKIKKRDISLAEIRLHEVETINMVLKMWNLGG